MAQIIAPSTCKAKIHHTTNLGTAIYQNSEIYSPDTDMWKSKALHIGPMDYKIPGYHYDRSRYRHTVTFGGVPTWVQLTNGLWVLSFDGVDDKLTIPDFYIPAPLTIIGIALTNDISSANLAIVSKIAADGTEREIWFGTATSGFNFIVSFDGTNWTVLATDTGLIVINKFYHFGATWDGTTAKIYITGNEVKSGAASGTLYNGTAAWQIGEALNAPNTQSWDGKISEVFLYSRVLSAPEMLNHYLMAKARIPGL